MTNITVCSGNNVVAYYKIKKKEERKKDGQFQAHVIIVGVFSFNNRAAESLLVLAL